MDFWAPPDGLTVQDVEDQPDFGGEEEPQAEPQADPQAKTEAWRGHAWPGLWPQNWGEEPQI